jgi:hypothetical protein
MSTDRPRPDAIDEALTQIEFPGEDEQWIRSYLDGRGFVATVMRAVAQTHIRLSRATVWGGIALLNVAILVVAGINPFLVEDVLALREELFTFFFTFLGITLAGCIVGLVLSIDSGRTEAFFGHIAKELSLDRIRNLFRHPR